MERHFICQFLMILLTSSFASLSGLSFGAESAGYTSPMQEKARQNAGLALEPLSEELVTALAKMVLTDRLAFDHAAMVAMRDELASKLPLGNASALTFFVRSAQMSWPGRAGRENWAERQIKDILVVVVTTSDLVDFIPGNLLVEVTVPSGLATILSENRKIDLICSKADCCELRYIYGGFWRRSYDFLCAHHLDLQAHPAAKRVPKNARGCTYSLTQDAISFRQPLYACAQCLTPSSIEQGQNKQCLCKPCAEKCIREGHNVHKIATGGYCDRRPSERSVF